MVSGLKLKEHCRTKDTNWLVILWSFTARSFFIADSSVIRELNFELNFDDALRSSHH